MYSVINGICSIFSGKLRNKYTQHSTVVLKKKKEEEIPQLFINRIEHKLSKYSPIIHHNRMPFSIIQHWIVLEHIQIGQHQLVDPVDFTDDAIAGAGPIEQKWYVEFGAHEQRKFGDRTPFRDKLSGATVWLPEPVMIWLATFQCAVDEHFDATIS